MCSVWIPEPWIHRFSSRALQIWHPYSELSAVPRRLNHHLGLREDGEEDETACFHLWPGDPIFGRLGFQSFPEEMRLLTTLATNQNFLHLRFVLMVLAWVA